MTAQQAIPYIAYVLDDALSPDHDRAALHVGAVLVGWQCGFEPLFVLVISSLMNTQGVRDSVDVDSAEEIATDYLLERQWFTDHETAPDYVIIVTDRDLADVKGAR